MTTTWTMTEARRRFRELLDRADRGKPTRITRRGQVAAVVVAPDDFQRLRTDTGTFTSSLRHFREATNTADLVDDELDGLRDMSQGRPVEL